MQIEPSDLSPADVAALVADRWGIHAASCTFLPVGFGAHHWGIEEADGQRWFVTADELPTDPEAAAAERSRLLAAYAAAADLADRGLPFVVAPEPKTNGRMGLEVPRPSHDYLLSVTEWFAGRSGDGRFADDADRRAVRAIVEELHREPAPAGIPLWDPQPPLRRELEALMTDLTTAWDSGPYSEPTRALLAFRRDEIARLYAALDERAPLVLAQREHWVPTHGEPHSANVLLTDTGPLLVDWESLALAPAARDLVTLEDPAAPMDGPVADLVRLRWWLWEVAIYGTQFARHHEGTADDDTAWNGLQYEMDEALDWLARHA